MTDDLQTYHHKFSVEAYNRAADILYAAAPSQADIESLIELAHVSHAHWQRRTDKTSQNIAVAQWLLSRAYSANGLGRQALEYAKRALQTIDGSGALPSGFGYAHEALARAYLCLGEREQARTHLDEARRISDTVPNAQAKVYLLDQINRVVLA
jgi:tetratricopeptide (TPR) repeat protein